MSKDQGSRPPWKGPSKNALIGPPLPLPPVRHRVLLPRANIPLHRPIRPHLGAHPAIPQDIEQGLPRHGAAAAELVQDVAVQEGPDGSPGLEVDAPQPSPDGEQCVVDMSLEMSLREINIQEQEADETIFSPDESIVFLGEFRAQNQQDVVEEPGPQPGYSRAPQVVEDQEEEEEEDDDENANVTADAGPGFPCLVHLNCKRGLVKPFTTNDQLKKHINAKDPNGIRYACKNVGCPRGPNRPFSLPQNLRKHKGVCQFPPPPDE